MTKTCCPKCKSSTELSVELKRSFELKWDTHHDKYIVGKAVDGYGYGSTYEDDSEVTCGCGWSCSNVSPMVERIKEWSGNRGLSLENPDVFGWQMRTAQPRKAVKLNPHDIDMLSFSYFGHNTAASMTHVYRAFAQQIEQAVLKANGVEE